MRLWLKQWAIALACYSLLSVVFALQQVRAALVLQDRRIAFWTALWPMMGINWIHASLVPAVIAWSRRLEPRRASLSRFLALHAAGYASYVALHAVLRVLLIPARNPATGAVYPRGPGLAWNVFLLNSADDLFMYAPIVGATMAYLAYSRSRTREIELAGAELQILKMQLHPHFLFNTLQAISTLVGKDPVGAKRTIALLADLLRAVLDRGGEQEVPLRDELDLLDRYAQIELVRFGDRLTIDMDFESDILHYRVPSLFFQPIVENAVRHGTRVEVAGAVRDGRLRLTVADNGPGLPPENERRQGGLGLDNTRARLKALYGADHSMELRNRPEGGLLVTVEIPRAMIRALIVDDEPLAREAIRDLLAADGAFEVAGECASGEEAVMAIGQPHPDVVFLDVQMPRMGGFAVVEAVGADRMPLTVFATAYDQYALKAFEAQALDYVLKPFDEERFRRVLERVRRQLERGTRPEGAGRLAIKSGGRTVFLRREEIRCFEASGNHVKVRTADASYLLRETIKSLEARLDPDRFVRIHRSTIVNVEHVREIRPWYTGEYIVVLTGGRELTLSRGYRANLPRMQMR